MNPRAARTLRGLTAGSVATLVAAASHGLGGGGLPGVAGLALALAFSVIVGVALAGRRLPLVRLAASVILSQLAFHVVFSTLGGAGETMTTGHGHHSEVVVTTAAQSVAHASSTMWLAHAAAALVTTLALVFGERAFYGLRDTARMLLTALFTPPAATAVAIDRAPLPAPMTFFAPRIVREFHAALGVRGPPTPLRGA